MNMKIKLFCIVTILSLGVFASDKKEEETVKETVTEEAFPVRISDEDLNGTNLDFPAKHLVLITFLQKIQLPDGSMTSTPGKVLVIQKRDTYMIGFFRPVDGGYVLADKPVPVKNIVIPRESVHPKHNVPCLIAKRQDGQGSFRIYILGGKAIIEPTE